LEQERAHEHSAQLQQRRFYERLLHPRKIESVVKQEPKQEIKPELRIETKPEIKSEPKSEIKKIEIPKPIISPPILQGESHEEDTAVVPKITKIKKPSFSFKFMKVFMKKSSLAQKLAQERKAEEAIKHKSEVEERFWQPYNSVKANLIKDQGVLFFNWKQRMLTLSLALVLSTLAIGLVYVGLLVWQKERLRDNQSTLANFEAINIEISKNENDIQEIVTFNRKLDIVSFILANHIYWTNFFKFLQDNTLTDVYYQNFSGDLTGSYTIPAIARNLDAASAQLELMKAYPLLRNVEYMAGQTVTDSTGDGQRVKFSLDMTLDPKIFVK